MSNNTTTTDNTTTPEVSNWETLVGETTNKVFGGAVSGLEEALNKGFQFDIKTGRLARYYDHIQLQAALELVKEEPSVTRALEVSEQLSHQLGGQYHEWLAMLFPGTAKELDKLSTSWDVMSRRITRSMLYLPTVVLMPRRNEQNPGVYNGAYYRTDAYRAPGALESLLRSMGIDEPGDFAQIEGLEVLNKKDGQVDRFFEALKAQGWVVVHGNLAVKLESAIGQAMVSILGDVQSFGAYGQTLINASIDPTDGMKIHKGDVIFVKAEYGEDGSGWCSPDVVNGYTHQFRAMELEHRLFAKGIIVPNSQLVAYRVGDSWYANIDNDVPEDAEDVRRENLVVLHYNQVKGSAKPWAKKQEERGGTLLHDVGVAFIQSWMRPNTMASGFELLQHVPRNKRSVELLTELIKEEIERINKTGWEERLNNAAEASPALAQTINVLLGLGINPLDIPELRMAAVKSLESELYRIAQGGFRGWYKVIKMDSRVPVGYIVGNFKGGLKAAAWRFPMLHAEGMRILTTAQEGLFPEFYVDGKYPPETVFMSPEDAVLMQGDDDGDCIAVSFDHRVIELFEMARTRARKYSIENPAKAKSWKDIDQFQDTIWGEKIPALVGAATVWQAGLYALKYRDFGDLMAWIIQAAVDSPKKESLLLDLNKCLHTPENELFVKVDGRWVPNNELWLRDSDGKQVTGLYNMREVKNFVLALFDLRGATYEVVGDSGRPFKKMVNVLQWRNPLADYEETHRVGLVIRKKESDLFAPITDGNTNWMNSVHGAYNITARMWQSSGLALNNETQSLRYLLGNVLVKKGLIPENWDSQFSDSDIIDSKNIQAYLKKVGKALTRGADENLLQAAVDVLAKQTEKMPLVWWACAWRACHAPISPEKATTRAKLIYNLMAHELCPIAEISAGIQRCKFSRLSEKSEQHIRSVVGHGTPAERAKNLVSYIYADTNHSKLHADGIPMTKCPDCINARKALVVSDWRGEKFRPLAVADLVTQLNQALQDDLVEFGGADAELF